MPSSQLCPAPTALPTNPNVTCRDILAKTARVLFQRNAAANYFDGTASPSTGIELANSWSGLPDASDGTKVTVSPLVLSVEFGEAATFDGAENYDGSTIRAGFGGTPVTIMWLNPTAAENAALRQLKGEENLGVIFIDADGNFLAKLIATDIHAVFPISYRTLRVNPMTRGAGKADEFMGSVIFDLAPGWDEAHDVIAPATGFNPLTAIVPS